MLYYLVAILYVLACFLLLLVILLQQGKGGDMASAFGGGGSQTAFGARAGATVLTKATAILGALFMFGAIGLGVIGQRGPGSLMGGIKAPPIQSAPAPKAPAPTPEKAPQQPEKK
jgi:preprotein translocase subunit SecG